MPGIPYIRGGSWGNFRNFKGVEEFQDPGDEDLWHGGLANFQDPGGMAYVGQ